MAEIYKFPFGGKSPENSPVTPASQEAPSVEADWNWAKANLETLKEGVQAAHSLRDFLANLPPGSYTEANVSLRRRGLKEHGLEHLCGILLASSDRDWNTHSAYYAGLIDEIEDRRTAVLASRDTKKGEH